MLSAAQLSDFGMSRATQSDETVLTNSLGAAMIPSELALVCSGTSALDVKADFKPGSCCWVLLLTMLSGRKSQLCLDVCISKFVSMLSLAVLASI